MDHIGSEHVSVVIQGPARRESASGPSYDVNDCVASVRQHLPQAEIIVSTWNGERLAESTDINVIYSPIPPAIQDANGNISNVNRQLVSTTAGLKAATRPYALKLRSDVALDGSGITQMDDAPHFNQSALRYVRSRITVSNIFTRDPVRNPMLFHLSDTIQFGRTEDLRAYWGTQPFEETWLRGPGGPRCNPFGTYAGYTSMRRTPEQALCIAWLHRQGLGVDIRHVGDGDGGRFELWERILVANFHVISWQEAQIRFPSRFTKGRYTQDMVYSREAIEWIEKSIDRPAYHYRIVRYYAGKYLWAFFRAPWYVSAASMVLFSLNPKVARRAQALWRKRIGWDRPEGSAPDRN